MSVPCPAAVVDQEPRGAAVRVDEEESSPWSVPPIGHSPSRVPFRELTQQSRVLVRIEVLPGHLRPGTDRFPYPLAKVPASGLGVV